MDAAELQKFDKEWVCMMQCGVSCCPVVLCCVQGRCALLWCGVLCCVVLCCVVLCCVVLCCVVLCCVVLCCVVLCCVVLCCVVLCCVVLCCVVLCCVVLCCVVLYGVVLCCVVLCCVVLCCVVLCCVVLCCVVLCCVVLCCVVLCCVVLCCVVWSYVVLCCAVVQYVVAWCCVPWPGALLWNQIVLSPRPSTWNCTPPCFFVSTPYSLCSVRNAAAVSPMRLIAYLLVTGLLFPPLCAPHITQNMEHATPRAVRDMDARFAEFQRQAYTQLSIRQYCLRWCQWDRRIRDLYPDFPAGSPARARLKSLPPYVSQFRRRLRRQTALIGVKCCQLCTQDCVQEVLDTRDPLRPDDVTLVTVVTPDRFAAVQRTRELWPGPLVLLLYLRDHPGAAAPDPSGIHSAVRGWNRTLVLQYVHRTERAVSMPINALRNMATDRVMTRYVFPLDADFLPSAGLYAALRGALPTLRRLDAFGVVVPHFEVAECARPGDAAAAPRLADYAAYPTAFRHLHALLRRGVVRAFHADLDFAQFRTPRDYACPAPPEPTVPNPEGVQITDYPRWLSASLALEERAAGEGARDDPLPLLALRYANTSNVCAERAPKAVPERPFDRWEPYVVTSRVTSRGTMPRYNGMPGAVWRAGMGWRRRRYEA